MCKMFTPLFTPICTKLLTFRIPKNTEQCPVYQSFIAKISSTKKGEAPVHLRIIKDRKISYISTGILLPEDHVG